MNIKVSTRVSLCLLFTLGLCINSYSQRQVLIGLNINGEVYPNELRPSFGLTLEKQFTKHSGVELGLLYWTKKSSGSITNTDASGSHVYSFTILQQHEIVPLLYKYYSSILNFSVGPTVDLYLGWKQKNDNSTIHIKHFDVDPKVKVGFLAKVSKVIPLNKEFVLEPEIRFGSVQTLDGAGIGVGISGKYRF